MMRHLEADRWYVSTGGDEYLVELGAYAGNGWCGCMQFQALHQPHLERNDDTIRRCKHLIKAFDEVG